MNVLKQLSHWLTPTADHTAAHLLTSLLSIAWFVEARDPYTGGHLWRVSRYALLLAQRTGFNDADAARISLGGFLHDLGNPSSRTLNHESMATVQTDPRGHRAARPFRRGTRIG
ncbi:MAG: HD domain-containing protein [Luteimonas sp.]